MSRKISLSIVIPCYNEQAVLVETADRIAVKLRSLVERGLVGEDSNVFFVDDGSSDQTWDLISGYARDNRIFHGVKLSRNFGHQNALLAGLMSADGDAVISLDADLQDDIEAMDLMLEKHLAGAEIVYGVRANRRSDTGFKRTTAQGYYKLLRKMGVDLVYNHGDYRLMGRRAIEAMQGFSEVNLFLRGIVPLLGFRTDTVYYERAGRFAGESKFSLGRMLAFAAEGITSFSNIPLRLITGLGFAVSLFAFLMIFWVLGIRFFTEQVVPGWASIVLPMFFLGGVQLLSIGVVGEYVAKIYLETKRRPTYIIDRVI